MVLAVLFIGSFVGVVELSAIEEIDLVAKTKIGRVVFHM